MLAIMCALAALTAGIVAQPASAENLVANPGFEQVAGDRPQGWTYNAEVASLVAEGAHEGDRCLKVRTDLPINVRYEMPYTLITLDEPVPVQADRVYWLSMWTRCPRYGQGYPALAYVYWLREDGEPAGIEKADVGSARRPHEWQMTRAAVVAPRDAVRARVRLVVWATYTDVFIDDVSLEPAEMPEPRPEPPLADKYRIMFFPEKPETAEGVQQVRDHGFNTGSFLFYKCYDETGREHIQHNLTLAEQAKLPALVAVWLSRVSPPEFRDQHPMIAPGGEAYKTTPCIFSQEWWEEWFRPTCLEFVRRSAEDRIIGLWVDFELYDEPPRVGDVCYCDRCMKQYEDARGLKIEGEDTPARVKWLLEHGRIGDYRDLATERLRGLAAELRAQTDAINPDFVYGDFPYYGFLADRAFAQGLGTQQAPFLIGPEYTYRLQSEHYSDSTAVQLAVNHCEEMQRSIEQDGLHARLVAGICPQTTAQFMADKTVAVCGQSDGYWLWTKRIIDAQRAAFGRQPLSDEEAAAAWEALRGANAALAGPTR